MKGYKVEIIPEDKEVDIHKGLLILARVIARQYLQRGMAVSDADRLQTISRPSSPLKWLSTCKGELLYGQILPEPRRTNQGIK